MKTIEFDANEIEILPGNASLLYAKVYAAESAVLGCFTLEEVVRQFGARELLDQIGQDEATAHFGLVPQE